MKDIARTFESASRQGIKNRGCYLITLIVHLYREMGRDHTETDMVKYTKNKIEDKCPQMSNFLGRG